MSLVCYKSDITQNFIVCELFTSSKKPRNYCVGRGKFTTLHALFGNLYDQLYFSFFSNCEEIKLSKAPPEK